MKYPKTIDLHMHSTVSDGTDTPEEILKHVKAAGIEMFSLTDHDTIKGCVHMKEILKDDDPLFITGAEFSCRDSEGRYHILGYGYDPLAASITGLVDKAHSLRMNKVRTRLDLLKSTFGFSFPEHELEELFSNDNPGKPHIANLMVKHGFAGNIDDAIYDYLNKLKVHLGYLDPEEVIAAILGAGGIPVLAHPAYGDGDQLILGGEMDARVRRLLEMGLKGLECFYSGFPDKLRAEMLALAERYSLYVTCGSDYHGGNKLVELGDTGLRYEMGLPAGLERFLEEMESHESAAI